MHITLDITRVTNRKAVPAAGVCAIKRYMYMVSIAVGKVGRNHTSVLDEVFGMVLYYLKGSNNENQNLQ